MKGINYMSSNTNNLVLYSTGCPNCMDLEDALEDARFEFTVVTDTAKMLQLGFDTVPMLEVAPNTYLNYRDALDWVLEHDWRTQE